MSLFKAREWWTTTVGEDEEFDQGCLCVANIDNSKNRTDKIIVGSYHGFLRIYSPRPSKTEDGWTDYKPEDVVCEMQMSQPVLQVEAGRFVSGSDGLHLAVLHPRKLSVYSLAAISGSVEHGTHYTLKLAYEHNLQRTAFNFCYGPFGGVKNRDFMCIQSMDGTVSVFEQESFAFSRFLPGALLPGPIKYLSRTDSFVTVSSSRQIECYKYQVLAVATDAKTKEESLNIKSGKRVAYDWCFNLGEEARDLFVVNFNNTQPTIYILGERSLFILTESGKLKLMKKLDFSPSCFVPYPSPTENSINCLVSTNTNTMMIYQDITLKWAAKLTAVPVQIKVANLHDMRGAIVTLDEAGRLCCCYLGTDPAMFAPPSAEVRELDYQDMDNEMQQLHKIIKEQQGKSFAPLPNTKAEDDIQIQVHVPPNLDEPSLAHDVEIQDEEAIPSITVKISLRAKSHVNDVKIIIHVPPPLTVNETLISFHSLEPSHPGETQVTFYMKQPIVPSELKAEVTAAYQSSQGAPRVVHASVRLPLKLVTRACLPVKTATYKITIDTNKAPANLNDLFPDLLGDNAGGPGNALGFKYYGMDPVVTVLASKTSQRYRLQCDDFAFMWLLLNEIVARLAGHFRMGRGSDFKISYDGALPLQEYFDILDAHFDARLNEDKIQKMLDERASQFRAIQRRLLTRFKDKTPSPLANLDTLLDGTYRQLLALADAMEENRHQQEQASAALGAATNSLNLLIKLWQDMTPDEFAVLQAALTPSVSINGSQGWEEMVDAAITHLLRTCLAKSSKDTTVNPAPLGILKDTTKLKKHVALVCDRLGKGARLVVEGQSPVSVTSSTPSSSSSPEYSKSYDGSPTEKPRKPIQTTLDVYHSRSPSANLGEPQVPEGSKFGEKSPKVKKEKKKKKELSSLNGQLPPLGGASDEGLDVSTLPPLSGPGNRFLKKKEDSSLSDQVPDLDDMGSPTDDDSVLVNGGNELVFGL